MTALLLLGIDSSGVTAAVALCENDRIIAQDTFIMNPGMGRRLAHSIILMPMVERIMRQTHTEWGELDGIAVAAGPGSYTGLRIGISAAKGMAFAAEISCVGISTLESLAWNVRQDTVCSIMTARQGVVYGGLYSFPDGKSCVPLQEDRIFTTEELQGCLCAKAKTGAVTLTGDGAENFLDNWKSSCSPSIRLAPMHLRYPLASSLCAAAWSKGLREGVERWTADNLNPCYLQNKYGQ